MSCKENGAWKGVGLSRKCELESQYVTLTGCDQPVEPFGDGCEAPQCEEWCLGENFLGSRLDVWNYRAYSNRIKALYEWNLLCLFERDTLVRLEDLTIVGVPDMNKNTSWTRLLLLHCWHQVPFGFGWVGCDLVARGLTWLGFCVFLPWFVSLHHGNCESLQLQVY